MGKKNRSYEIESLSQTAGGSGLADHSGEGVSSPVWAWPLASPFGQLTMLHHCTLLCQRLPQKAGQKSFPKAVHVGFVQLGWLVYTSNPEYARLFTTQGRS